MKVCTRCKESKPLTEFNYKFKEREIFQYHCKECSRKYVQAHYSMNREYYLQKARKRNGLVRKQIRDYVLHYLNAHSCVDCGENDPNVLEFDHIRDKSFVISSIGRNKTLRIVRDEIKKCEVRCANCHRRKTALKAGWNKRLPL